MNNINVASNVININTCNRDSNWQVEKIKCLINIYLFIHLKLWSTSRYTVCDVIHCRLSMSFSNYNNSAVKRTGLGKCHIQLAIGKTADGRYIANWLKVCTGALQIVITNVNLMWNWLYCEDFNTCTNLCRLFRDMDWTVWILMLL
jgi:hypothetical protein